MILVDTVAWLYLFDAGQSSPESGQAKAFLAQLNEPLATTDLIISETHKWLVHHGRPVQMAQKVLRKLVQQEIAHILAIEAQDQQQALKWVEKYQDQKLSYTDSISVALMYRLEIQKVFSFDRHFLLFPGIQRVP